MEVYSESAITCFFETFSKLPPQISSPSHTFIHFPAVKDPHVSHGRHKSGISLAIKDRFLPFVKILITNENWILLWFDTSNITTAMRKIFIFFCYAPNRLSNVEWGKIEIVIQAIANKNANVLIMGDLNARVALANLNMTFTNNNKKLKYHRISRDSKHGQRGSKLEELTKSCKLTILNGRSVSDPFGSWTCIHSKGSSEIDLALISNQMVNYFHDFQVT